MGLSFIKIYIQNKEVRNNYKNKTFYLKKFPS